MSDKSKFEQMLEKLVADDKAAAEEIFHNIVVEKSRSIVVIKRSMNVGFAGLDNDIFYNEKTLMFFGDAKDSIDSLTKSFKELN